MAKTLASADSGLHDRGCAEHAHSDQAWQTAGTGSSKGIPAGYRQPVRLFTGCFGPYQCPYERMGKQYSFPTTGCDKMLKILNEDQSLLLGEFGQHAGET